MFKIISVQLKNIRSHEDFTFTPESTGITTIKGPTGSGKSSIVDGLTWCLYGTKPAGVAKNSAMVRKGVSVGKKEKSYVEAIIETSGKIVKIQRRVVSKAGTVECDVWIQDGDGVFQHASGSAVSFSDKFIRSLIGIDEKGFLATIHVQQKQVDSLINSKDRGRVIEDLTGISSLTKALAFSRADSNALKKAIRKGDVDAEEANHRKIEREVSSLKKSLEAQSKIVDRLLKTKKAKEESFLEAKEKYFTAQEDFDKNSAIVEEISVKKTLVDELTKEFNDKTEKVNVIQKEVGSNLYSKEKFSEIEAEIDNTSQSIARIDSEISFINRELDEIRLKKNSLEEILSKAPFKNMDELNLYLDRQESELSKNKTAIKEIESKISENKGNILSIKNAIATFRQNGATCPTCLQTVDSTSEAIESLTFIGKNLSNENKSLLGQVQELEEKVSRTENKISKATQVKELLNEDYKAQEKTLSEKLDKSKVSLSKLESTLKKLKADKEKYRDAYEKSMILSNARNEALAVSRKLEEVSVKLAELEASKPVKVVSKTRLSSLRAKFDKLNEEYSEAKLEYEKKAVELNGSRNEFALKEEILESSLAKLSEMKEQIGEVETAVKTTEVIEKFREDRILSSVPLIEGYASSLVEKFTNGKFQGIKIDEKFNVEVVLEDGDLRPVGMLSGGELSASALALRLGIAMFFNSNGDENGIILDEVFVSQDSERAELILNTVKEMFPGQVIMIAHNDMVSAVSDKIIELHSK